VRGALRKLWGRLPALVRGSILAFVILSIGQLPPGLFLAVGLQFTPRFPWWPVATVLWLWLFWQYLSGHWWPAGTRDIRRQLLRAHPLSARVWLWSILAGGFGLAGVLSIALLTGFVADLPREAYVAPLDLTRYPSWSVLAFFFNIALVAGVVEEAAFRGYMLSVVERRHGWWVAIASVAVLFYVVHLSHAYATPAFVPFFMTYSVVHGMLVFLTRSIRPSVLLHAAGDFVILPIQYGVVRDPMGASIRGHVVAVVFFGFASMIAFWYLARIRSDRRG
jgi:membrane protease YdiL (CAAX protease family)